MTPTEPIIAEKILKAKQRSLHIVLVLTFIGSGFSALGYLSWALMLPQMKPLVSSFPEEMASMVDLWLSLPRGYYAIFGLLSVLSVVGAAMMWSFRRIGFHFYALAQMLLLVVQGLFLGRAHLAIGDVMLTALFIAFYYFTLRAIGRLPQEVDTHSKVPPSEPDAE